MIRLITAVLLFASFYAAAEVTLTDINNNEVADAEEVMGDSSERLKEVPLENIPSDYRCSGQVLHEQFAS